MKNSIMKHLLPASALALLASLAQPALRADDPATTTVGAVTESSMAPAEVTAKDAGSAGAPVAAKKKKKKGKKKKKPSEAPASDGSTTGAAAAPAAPAADATK